MRQKPQKLAFFLAKNTKIRAYSVRFHLSKVLSRLAWRVFSLQKYFHCLPEAFSPFKRTFVAPLGAVLGFKSIFIASPRRFQPSKVLLLLRSAYFGVQKFFCCLPEAISGFKRTFVASPKCFHLSKVLLRLASQRDALFTDFLFARNARIFVSQRSALLTEFSCGKLALIFLQKPQKFAPFTAKSTKIRAYSVRFHLSKAVLRPIRGVFGLQKFFGAVFSGKSGRFKEQLKFASKCRRKL